MRIRIKTTDRIGITQEVLSIFAKQAWNLKAVEVSACVIFVHIEESNLSIKKVNHSLQYINGILTIENVDNLPTEQREKHLQILLDRIPDPIIDVNNKGIILAVNQASHKLLNQKNKKNKKNKIKIIGTPIEYFIGQKYQPLLKDKSISKSLSLNGQTFLADINPIKREDNQAKNDSNNTSGAVIILRSMNTLGKQISLMQTYQDQSFDSIIGQSDKIKLLKEQSKRFAKLELPVLIQGETGTGKELLARALHHASSRAESPFLAINCAALPENLLESELFGYATGAFTGARKGGKPGLFELAEGGTIFLDEIAEMSTYLQAKLLRFLQDLIYRRVGGTQELKANVRIISASHQNLAKLITQQNFREDLYYRLNVLNLELPALKNRLEDILPLSLHFIENAVKQIKTSSQQAPTLTKQALQALYSYSWPGNIRQLQNVLFRIVALSNSTEINQKDIEQVLTKPEQNEDNSNNETVDLTIKNWAMAQATFEEKLLRSLYPLFPTTRKLAERLAVSHNKIAMKLREHDIK